MQKTLGRLRLFFLGVFALATAAIWTYQLGWVAPRQRCEAAHRWWAAKYRECAVPVSTSVFTHRPIPGQPLPAIVPAGPPPARAAR